MYQNLVDFGVTQQRVSIVDFQTCQTSQDGQIFLAIHMRFHLSLHQIPHFENLQRAKPLSSLITANVNSCRVKWDSLRSLKNIKCLMLPVLHLYEWHLISPLEWKESWFFQEKSFHRYIKQALIVCSQLQLKNFRTCWIENWNNGRLLKYIIFRKIYLQAV